MSVLLGINPITWTNDDMPELGGDIPLDVCLSEARMAGFAGIELGGKFPRTRRRIGPDPRRATAFGWFGLVQRADCAERTADAEIAAVAGHLQLLAGWTVGDGLRRGARQHRRQRGRAAVHAAAASRGGVAGFCERLNAVARHLAIAASASRFIITWARWSRPRRKSIA